MIKAHTLFERLSMLSSPYENTGKRKQKAVIESVFKKINNFLNTTQGSVLLNPEYGMETPAFLSEMVKDSNRNSSFMFDLKTRIHNVDKRIHNVNVTYKNFQKNEDSNTIPFFCLDIFLVAELSFNEYEQHAKFSIAYDLTGKVYALKN